MTTIKQLISIVAILFSLQASLLAQSTLLDGAQYRSVSVPVNDVVYDRVRDVLYASIPSTAGAPYGNSIATIDPATGNVIASTFVGSEPNTLAISHDASRVYVGIDGTRSMRWWQPTDSQLGNPQPLLASGIWPGVAHDIAVPPGSPNTAVVSVDEVGNTGNGDLYVFTDAGSMRATGVFHDANYIGFLNSSTMASFDDSNTGFKGQVWQLSGMTLTSSLSRNYIVSNFDVEAEVGSDGLLYFTNGTVVDGSTLNPAGTYTTGLSQARTLVEPITPLKLTYFVSPSGTSTVLKAFDSRTFLEIDSVQFPIASSSAQDRGELIAAGKNRLAFVWKPQTFDGPGGSGTLHIVSGVPVEIVPEPFTLPVIAIAGLIAVPLTRRRA